MNISKNLNHILAMPSDGYKVPKNATIGKDQKSVMYKSRGLVRFYITRNNELDCSVEGLGASSFDFIRDAWNRIQK